MDNKIRLNKYLADKKIASRREADTLIKKKQVMVNGKPAIIGQKINPDEDKIKILGRKKTYTYLAYYKGVNIITHSPTKGETDIATRLHQDYGLTNLSPVGRLDKSSEGLIIVTNDGRVTGPLLNPDNNHEKEYSVLVDKKITNYFLKNIRAGVNIEGYVTKPAQANISPKNDKRFTIILTEGKKHQIRRMCAALGYQVKALKRTRIMNIKLGKLKPNQYRKIKDKELQDWLKNLGLQKT